MLERHLLNVVVAEQQLFAGGKFGEHGLDGAAETGGVAPVVFFRSRLRSGWRLVTCLGQRLEPALAAVLVHELPVEHRAEPGFQAASPVEIGEPRSAVRRGRVESV